MATEEEYSRRTQEANRTPLEIQKGRVAAGRRAYRGRRAGARAPGLWRVEEKQLTFVLHSQAYPTLSSQSPWEAGWVGIVMCFFSDKEIWTQRNSDLPKVTQLVCKV